MAKGILILFSLISLSVSTYLGLALSEEPISMKYLPVLPIFLTTINSILATCAVFYKLPAKIIFWVSIVIVLGGVVNIALLALDPSSMQFGFLPFLIFLVTEPPFFVPLLLYNAWIPIVLWRTSKTPDPELLLANIQNS